MRWSGLLLCLLWCWIGCTTREQGCLDIYASNFDLTAEKACDDCCQYPSLNISLSQLWDTIPFNIDSQILVDIHGTAYKLKDIKYFLSDWVLHEVNGERISVDSALLGCIPPVTYSPDVVIIDSRQFNYQLGIIRTAPLIESVEFTLGLETDYPCIADDTTNNFTRLTKRSPLWNAQTNALSTIRLIIQPDLQVETVDTLFIDLIDRESITYPYQFEKGSHTSLRLSVDYADWFATVDLQNLSSVGTSIAAGFPGSIFPTP